MGLVWMIWSVSLLLMAMIMLRSYATAHSRGEFRTVTSMSTGDILRNESRVFSLWVMKIFAIILPKFFRMMMHLLVLLQNGFRWMYQRFMDKVLGKERLAPGKTTSFFIKHISEFKEELARDDRI